MSDNKDEPFFKLADQMKHLNLSEPQPGAKVKKHRVNAHRSFSESQVKELLQKQREKCESAYMHHASTVSLAVADRIRKAVLTI